MSKTYNLGVGIMPDDKPLTVEEVAEQLRVNPETVRTWIRTGELNAVDVGGKYRIYPADLEDFKRRRSTRRHPDEKD
jgi:excisionase family DNA binding protein